MIRTQFEDLSVPNVEVKIFFFYVGCVSEKRFESRLALVIFVRLTR